MSGTSSYGPERPFHDWEHGAGDQMPSSAGTTALRDHVWDAGDNLDEDAVRLTHVPIHVAA